MLSGVFKRGLIAVAPLALTLALVQWLFGTLEQVFSFPIKALIGQQYYFHVLGIIVALVFIFLIGSVINNWVIQKISSMGNMILKKTPLVKTLYNAIYEMMSYFDSKNSQKERGVVMVDIHGIQLLGLVTREHFEGIAHGVGTQEDVAVFLPLSYQIGGHTIIVPRAKVRFINMSVEDAMRFCVTAGVLTQNKK